MLFNTYEPWKFAFSSESIDLYDLDVSESKGDNESNDEFAKSKKWGIHYKRSIIWI